MILVDTCVWIDHLRSPLMLLDTLLDQGSVLCHPFIVGEIGISSLHKRAETIASLRALPSSSVAMDDEVQMFVTDHKLFVIGIGYVDAHLIAATKLTSGALFWTRDKRLLSVAERLDLALSETPQEPN